MIGSTCITVTGRGIDAFDSIETRAGKAPDPAGQADWPSKTFYATKLIEENIEDLEDRYLAEARIEKRGKSYTSAEVRSQLGRED